MNPLTAAVRKLLTQPAFIAAFVVLFVAALSLNAATSFLKLYFKKEPVPLARALEKIPPTLGPWVQVSIDKPLDPEMLDVLATREYVFRNYVDTRAIRPAALAQFNDRTGDEREMLAARLQLEKPGAVVRMAVTYYTGMVDTVAHIPDRCYVADGFVPDDPDTLSWKAPDKNGNIETIPARYIHFEDATTNRNAMPRNVAYFFHCNGAYESDPIGGVRVRLQDLRQRHGYYLKCELMTIHPKREDSQRVMSDFLVYAIPEIEKCLPDWQKVISQPRR